MADLPRDQNNVPVAGGVSSSDSTVILPFKINPSTGRLLTDSASAAGTVTSVSVVSANGFAGSVANATTTPAITLSTTINSPVLAGNGTAISAATTTGSGSTVVLATSPTLVTPNIGAATGTSLAVSGALTSQTSLVLEETGAGSDTITIQAPAAIAASYTLTLPVDDGNNGEFLQTNGSGTLAWAAGSSGITIGTTTVSSGTNTRILYNNAGVVGEYTLTGTGTVVVMATSPTFTTGATTPQLLASANDSGALGASGTAFSDLFLASGGVINWLAGDATITHSAGLLTTNVPVTITGVATASGFAPTSSTATGNRMYLPAADTLGFAINGTGEVQLTSTALSPITNDGNALGTTALGWADLHLATGGVINWANSEITITETDANTLTVAGATVVSLGTSAAFTTGTIELGAASDTTLARVSTGVVSIEGVNILTVAGGTLTGSITLGENTSIALDPAGSADGKYSGITIAGTAGATLAFGDLVYLSSVDSRWELADADSATTSDRMMGMCVLAAAADGDPTVLLLMGQIRADAAFPALTIGSAVYVGETAGDIQVAIPTGADNIIRRVGYALTADEIYFNPSMDSQITVA